jgi:hypothetical protein
MPIVSLGNTLSFSLYVFSENTGYVFRMFSWKTDHMFSGCFPGKQITCFPAVFQENTHLLADLLSHLLARLQPEKATSTRSRHLRRLTRRLSTRGSGVFISNWMIGHRQLTFITTNNTRAARTRLTSPRLGAPDSSAEQIFFFFEKLLQMKMI